MIRSPRVLYLVAVTDFTILVDSSTKPTGKANKYGESCTAWAGWYEGTLKQLPMRSGIHYCRYEGPNKAFYYGLIAALQGCFPVLREHGADSVLIFGDCEPVLRQLTGEWGVGQMKDPYEQTQAIIRRYRAAGLPVYFDFLNESDPLYKQVDRLSKEGRGLVNRMFSQK